MRLRKLSLHDFKNYESAHFAFDNKVNCFLGKNGVGKTNILDAVHYLSICKSYMNVVDRQNIRFDQPFFVIQGDWVKEGGDKRLNV